MERDLEAGRRHAGGLLEDAPAFGTVAQLLELAEDRKGWRVLVRDLLPDTNPAPDRAEGMTGVLKEKAAGGRSRKRGVDDSFMVGAGFHLEGGVWLQNRN